MPDDAELLRRYAGTRAEDAFAELVRRHLDGVYSAALRRVGGGEFAEFYEHDQSNLGRRSRRDPRRAGHGHL